MSVPELEEELAYFEDHREELVRTSLGKFALIKGSETRACYPIQIVFPGAPFPPFTSPVTMSVNLQFGKTPYILLFGRDLLSKIKFAYNGPAGRIEMAF